MRKLKKALSGKKGELHLDSLLSVFILFLCLSIALAVMPVIVQKHQLDVLTKEAARFVEIQGSTSGIDAEVQRLASNIGCMPDRYQTSTSGKIQLRDEFTVTAELDVDIGFAVGIRIPVTLTSVASGRGEVYWK